MGPLLVMTLQVLFLALPLLITALAHGLLIKYDLLASLKRPLDLGLTLRNRRVFGDNKTVRGLLTHVIFCCLGTLIQAQLQEGGSIPPWVYLADYERHWFMIGILMGLGMTLGELPNSFAKRQLDIPPGEKARGVSGILFFVLDQVDLTIGIWAFLYVPLRPSVPLILWSLLLTLVLHMGVSATGYVLRMRKTVV
ncbi:MAG: CDP-archaeol synthase [Deltaproteobacteria bacterium]|nr:CDP-archaeol synthase [Deltaproteobacteria bacterium]MBW2136976.1 CDP-archaeol synthase [Deltaproteobacteria bacterium]